MIISSSAGLLTVCGRHVALWRTPLSRKSARGLSSRISDNCDGSMRNPGQNQLPRIPPVPILKPGFQPTGVNKDGVYLGSTFLMLSPHTLPELDVSPLLNKKSFARKTGGGTSTINGNDAATRLSKAKNELREIIHQELEETTHGGATTRSSSSSDGGVKKMYIMRRHGVPNQLLQHLVTVADQWLEQKNALELWVDSNCQGSLSVLTTEGSSWKTLWPNEWDDDVALHLATMKRMVSHLGSMTPFCDGSSVLPGDLEWRLSISRHNKLPLTLFPNDPEVFPVIEWMTPPPHAAEAVDSNAASNDAGRRMGKILIRMQGATNPVVPLLGQEYLKQSHDVSLVFEAFFDVDAGAMDDKVHH